jgi:uncharacterized metal-binding protein
MEDRGNQSTRLIYACSGAADVGAIADRIGRKLSQAGLGKMTCLAAVGANLEGYVNAAKAAENFAIDGCPVACARKNLERLGAKFQAFVLTDMGLVKGQTPVTDSVVEQVAAQIQRQIDGGQA